jgi:hypothetical protein
MEEPGLMVFKFGLDLMEALTTVPQTQDVIPVL